MKHRLYPSRNTILALSLSLPLFSGSLWAQGTHTYTPVAGGSNMWDDSSKWGLPSGFPSGAGTVVNLPRIASATTLNLNGNSPIVGVLNLGSGAGTGAWTLTNGTLTLDNGASPAVINNSAFSTATFSANIQSSKSVTLQGAYTMLFTNASSRLTGGITLAGGNVYFYSGNTVSQSDITLNGGGNLVLGNNTATQVTLASNFETLGTGIKRGIYSSTTSKLQLNGNISGVGGIRFGTTDASRSDVTELTGANSYSGGTTIETNVLFHSIANLGTGALEFSTNSKKLSYATGNTADITTNISGDARAVTFNVNTTIDIAANDVTYLNSLGGSAVLSKEGLGTLTLAGSNSISGLTVRSGKIIAAHQNALGGDAANTQLLTGTNLEIASDDTVKVANLNIASGARVIFNLGGNLTDPLLAVNGDLSGSESYLIEVNPNLVTLESQVWTLLSLNGNAFGSNFLLDPSSQPYGTLNWNASTGNLTFTAIPEPSSYVMLGMALLGGISLRGRLRVG